MAKHYLYLTSDQIKITRATVEYYIRETGVKTALAADLNNDQIDVLVILRTLDDVIKEYSIK